MNTIFKYRILACAALAVALLAGTSCEDNTDIVDTSNNPNADKTLYDVIINDSELTDFVEVLDSCTLNGVSVADSLFNKSRVYTLWAPKNKAFDKDSILDRIKDGYRDDVMRTFVQSHVANHLHPAKGVFEKDNYVLMLNDKMVLFEGSYKPEIGYKFAGQTLAEANIKVWNGMLHKLDKASEYRYNIWEYLKLGEEVMEGWKVDSFSNYLYSYDDRRFRADLSILGPTVDGVQTFLDSVWVTSNKMLSIYGGIAPLNAEDSSYTVYVPTNDAWESFLAKAKTHFNYKVVALENSLKSDTILNDSIREYYPRYNMLKYLAFSDHEQVYAGIDSIMPANRDKWERPGFPKEKLESKVVYSKILSNGKINIVNEFPYTVFDLWHDTIKIQGEDASMRYYISGEDQALVHYVYEDDVNPKYEEDSIKLAGSGYFEALASSSSVVLQYKLPNVKSASYKIAVVIVPKDIKEEFDESEVKPTRFRCNVIQSGAENLYVGKSYITTDPTRLDTVFLPDLVKSKDTAVVRFPVCEYYNTHKQEDFTTLLQMTTSGSTKTYDRSLRIDEILLIPVEDAE